MVNLLNGQFMPQKAIKRQELADLLAEYPDPRTIKLYEELSNEIVKVFMT